jgi:carbonic anhydrase
VKATDELLDNNDAYARGFAKGELPRAPRRRVAVVACMDARLDPARALGLEEGDAHVIRNAGGLATDDTIRSLAISQRKLGTEEIVLILHTDCGLLGFSDEEFKREIAGETGEEPAWAAETFSDVDEGVRESIARVGASPFLPHKESIRGLVYEVETGRLREVADPPPPPTR